MGRAEHLAAPCWENGKGSGKRLSNADSIEQPQICEDILKRCPLRRLPDRFMGCIACIAEMLGSINHASPSDLRLVLAAVMP
jgi:hypothetical protein